MKKRTVGYLTQVQIFVHEVLYNSTRILHSDWSKVTKIDMFWFTPRDGPRYKCTVRMTVTVL